MGALGGCVWQCVSAVRWMLASLAVLEVTVFSTEIHTLCPCLWWVTWCSLSGNPRWLQLLFELALSTQSLYWTWVWGQGTICSGQGLLGMVLDKGRVLAQTVLHVFAADSSHLLSVLGFDQAGHENITLPWRLVRSKFQRIIELSAVWVSQLWNIIHPTACICI